MGVLADKIQSFIDTVSNATTAMDDDVVEGKAYWKGNIIQPGIMPHVDTDAYSVNIASNKEDINVVFLKKTYTLPADIVTIPNALLTEVIKQKTEIHCTDSKDDLFYNPDIDGDFYDKIILENYWNREVDLPNISLCTDDFLINSTSTNHIIVTQEWLNKYPDKKDYFNLLPDSGDYICSVDGNLVPFYDALPDWALTEVIPDDINQPKTWIINSEAVKFIVRDIGVVGFVVLKGYEEEDYHQAPSAGRIYFPAGVKIIIDETIDETTLGDFTFHNKSIVRYGNDGVTINEQLKPLNENSILLNLKVNGIDDIIDTDNEELDNFESTGLIPVAKVIHAYQESANSNRHVIMVNQPFIFDFKYSVLRLVDDGGIHVSGGDNGLSEEDIPTIEQTVSSFTEANNVSEDTITHESEEFVYTNNFMINNSETLIDGSKMIGTLTGLENTYGMDAVWGLKMLDNYHGYKLYVLNKDIVHWKNELQKQITFCWMSKGIDGTLPSNQELPEHYRIYFPEKSIIIFGDVLDTITEIEDKTWLFNETKFTGERTALTADMIIKGVTVNVDGEDIEGTLPIINTVNAYKIIDKDLYKHVRKKTLHDNITDYALVLEEACVYDNEVSRIICVD